MSYLPDQNYSINGILETIAGLADGAPGGATIVEVIDHEESTLDTSTGLATSSHQADAQIMEIDDSNDALASLEEPMTQTVASSSCIPSIQQISKPRASSVPLSMEAKHRFGYVYDVRMMMHVPTSEHPETPDRIVGIFNRLRDNGLLKFMKLIPIRDCKKMEVLLVHSEDHWDKVEAIKNMTVEDISLSYSYYDHLSLYVCANTTKAALLSCGGTIEAALAVARGELQKTFAIVRPPGHHAEPEEHMGFCFFNNVAIAARVVQQLTPIKRILILDWDVHHGNGTQRAFYDDPSVLYISLHRYDGGQFYPGGPFGGLDQCGVDEGVGKSVNIPWPQGGMGDADYLHAFTKIVMPIAMEFAPELVLISAGFDAAEGDDLGECRVTPAGYAHMTHMLSGLAGGRLVVALEGGYNVESISRSSLAVTRTIIGEAPPEMPPLVASELGTETVWTVAMQQSKYWKSVDPKASEPKEDYGEEAIPVSELIKHHRQEYLYHKLNMVSVPLLDDLDQRFNAQVLCSENILDQETLVLFVHQFGNLRVELADALTYNANTELSYLIDVSKQMVEWVESKGFSYVEINTFPKPLQHQTQKRLWTELGRELIVYLWDNYIQLSRAENIILIGHGPGCSAVMELMAQKAHNVVEKVKAVCMIVGYTEVPQTPRDEPELREWYIKHSFVAVPKDHPAILQERLKSRHGLIVQFDEPREVKLLAKALPNITHFIEGKL